jgi:hypothetical protein
VTHRATPRFWRCYEGLPQDVRQLADRSYALLKANPSHPSLHFKKVGRFWSARVGLSYRAVAVEAGADLAWFWIGSHADYDTLLSQKSAKTAVQPTRQKARRQKSTRTKPARG